MFLREGDSRLEALWNVTKFKLALAQTSRGQVFGNSDALWEAQFFRIAQLAGELSGTYPNGYSSRLCVRGTQLRLVAEYNSHRTCVKPISICRGEVDAVGAGDSCVGGKKLEIEAEEVEKGEHCAFSSGRMWLWLGIGAL